MWEVGVWEAPRRSRSRERVCGPHGARGSWIHRSGTEQGGSIRETLLRRWHLESRKCGELPRWPCLLPVLVGICQPSPSSSSSLRRSFTSSLAPRLHVSPHLSFSDVHALLPEKIVSPPPHTCSCPTRLSRDPISTFPSNDPSLGPFSPKWTNHKSIFLL